MIDRENAQSAEFLDRLVHDLREPLRSIGAFSELLSEIAKGRLGAEGDQVLSEILGRGEDGHFAGGAFRLFTGVARIFRAGFAAIRVQDCGWRTWTIKSAPATRL